MEMLRELPAEEMPMQPVQRLDSITEQTAAGHQP